MLFTQLDRITEQNILRTVYLNYLLEFETQKHE